MKMRFVGLGAAALCAIAPALAQTQTGLPTSQPQLLQIIREEVKVGHNAEHERTEAGWPAAFEKAKSPYYYLAFVSLTGAPEAWFVSGFDSHEQMEQSMAFERKDPALAAELARLQRADGEHLTGLHQYHAIARKELSYGEFPDMSKQRYWEITTVQMRPGHEADFAAGVKAYTGAMTRAGVQTGLRVYKVVAGMPSPTYIVFRSMTTFAGLDKMRTEDEATTKAIRPEDENVFQQFFDGLVSSDTQRFELNPTMSYVSPEVRASDAAFWMPKKPAPPQ